MRFPRLHNVMRSMRSVAWRNVRIKSSIPGSCIQRHQTWRCCTAKGPVCCSTATTTKHRQSQGSGKWRNPSAYLSGLPGSLHTRSAYHNAQRLLFGARAPSKRNYRGHASTTSLRCKAVERRFDSLLLRTACRVQAGPAGVFTCLQVSSAGPSQSSTSDPVQVSLGRVHPT